MLPIRFRAIPPAFLPLALSISSLAFVPVGAAEPVILLSENFDSATLPTTLPLNTTLPNSFGFYSTNVKIELVENPVESYGGNGRSLKATYPSISGGDASAPWSGFGLSSYNTDHVYVRFRAKMPKGRHGFKFLKVFGQRSDTTGYANTTFGLDYTGVDSGLGSMFSTSYGDGSELDNDTASAAFFVGGGSFGRATGLPGFSASAPQQRDFRASDWGTGWHLFECYVKFNSGNSPATEKNDGAIMVRIDGQTYLDVRGLYNRHYKNLPIDRVEILGWSQTARGAPTAETEIWYDDIQISLNGWPDLTAPANAVISIKVE